MTPEADVPAPTGDPVPVALHVRVWNPGASTRVLLLHGLGSDGATMWRFADAVAAAGATAVAPDLRNHGLSPTTTDHRREAYAADVALLSDGWDLVVGHSLGAAVLTELCARPGFARRAVLLDPVLQLTGAVRGYVRETLATEVEDQQTHASIAAANPRWSPEDVHRKVLAGRMVSRRTTELTLAHNDPWDVRPFVERWACPVHLVAADPAHGALLQPEQVADARAMHPGVTATTVAGTGHSVHRDDPAAVLEVVLGALAAG